MEEMYIIMHYSVNGNYFFFIFEAAQTLIITQKLY